MHDQHGAPSSVMNPMTPKLAVAATLTRWRHPPLKSSEKRSWATEGDMKKKLSNYICGRQSLAFKNTRMEDTHFKVSSSAPLGKGTRVQQWTPWWQMDPEQWRQADVSGTWSDQQQRPNTSPCSKAEQKKKTSKRWVKNKQKEEGRRNEGNKAGGRKQRRDIKRRTSKGRVCRRKWEWATQWGAGERGERKEKELREGEGECFYPHVHSVKGVSECDCSWTACQNSAATTAAMNLRPSPKCMRAQTHTNTLTYTCANAFRVSKSFW